MGKNEQQSPSKIPRPSVDKQFSSSDELAQLRAEVAKLQSELSEVSELKSANAKLKAELENCLNTTQKLDPHWSFFDSDDDAGSPIYYTAGQTPETTYNN